MIQNQNNKIYTYILRDLYNSSNGLYPFTLYKRYKISARDMFLFIKKYSEKGFVNYSEDKLSLSEKGQKAVFSEIFHNKTTKGLKSNLPNNYLGNKLDKNIPYIPIIDYLSKELKHGRK